MVKVKKVLITVFVIVWTFIFHYESLRLNYLNPFFGRELPKLKFLFPPAGWIMFYQVNNTEVRAEVYGQKGDTLERIDPHRIFNNHWLGYDNIRRNVLVSALSGRSASSFCRYLRRKFPEYNDIAVAQVIHSPKIQTPDKKILKVAYRC